MKLLVSIVFSSLDSFELDQGQNLSPFILVYFLVKFKWSTIYAGLIWRTLVLEIGRSLGILK